MMPMRKATATITYMYVGIIEHEFTAETVTQQRDGNEFHGFFAQLGVVEEYIMKGE